MSKKQVQEMLGPPQDIMTQQAQGAMLETWRYLDRTITFQSGVVQSWALNPVVKTTNSSQRSPDQ